MVHADSGLRRRRARAAPRRKKRKATSIAASTHASLKAVRSQPPLGLADPLEARPAPPPALVDVEAPVSAPATRFCATPLLGAPCAPLPVAAAEPQPVGAEVPEVPTWVG